MKQITLVFIFAVWCSMGWGQTMQVPLSLVSNAGGLGQLSIGGNNVTVEWTLGETIIGAGGFGNYQVTNGEQQPDTSRYTGITELQWAEVNVFPNPSSGYFNIVNLPEGENQLTVMDISGKQLTVETTRNIDHRLDLSRLASGAYLLNIRSSQDNSSKTKIILITQ